MMDLIYISLNVHHVYCQLFTSSRQGAENGGWKGRKQLGIWRWLCQVRLSFCLVPNWSWGWASMGQLSKLHFSLCFEYKQRTL
jgi:hypothetical protein